MAYYRVTKKQSGGGGITFQNVLTAGVVSTNSAYATATFNDISSYKYAVVKVYDTVSGVDYADYAMFDISNMSSGRSFTVTLHRSVTMTITPTSIASNYYSGSYYYIYADVYVTNDEIIT